MFVEKWEFCFFIMHDFKYYFCIYGIIISSDLVHQHFHETEHLYYLFGSFSKRIMPLCYLMDHTLVPTLNELDMSRIFILESAMDSIVLFVHQCLYIILNIAITKITLLLTSYYYGTLLPLIAHPFEPLIMWSGYPCFDWLHSNDKAWPKYHVDEHILKWMCNMYVIYD